MSNWGTRSFNPSHLFDLVYSHTSVSFLKKHMAYSLAKYHRRIEEAFEVCENVIKHNIIEDLKNTINSIPLIIPVSDQEDASTNVLPISYAHILARELNGVLVGGITKSTRQSNTDSGMYERISNSISFDGNYDLTDKEIILVDDTWTVGGTVMALADHVIKQGGKVRAISTLSSGRYGKSIAHREVQYLKLANLLSLTLDEFFVKYEHAIKQATGSELQAAILSGKGARRLLEYANSKRN